MATTLTFRNAVTAFVRRRNRWEPAVLIPIQSEEGASSRTAETFGETKVERIRHRLLKLFRFPAK